MLERFQARRVEITSCVTLPREVDGEVISPGDTLTVMVQPSTLTVRVPTTLQQAAIGTAVKR
jgi:diacylglycerol kinase family enzyme